MRVSHHSSHLGLSVIMMQNNEAMYPGSLFTNGARARELGRERVSEREMPHVEQWDLVWFPSNIHKQEQTKFAAQSNCNFLFTLKFDLRDMLASSCLNLMIQQLIIIWLFTSTTPLGFIKKGGGKKKCPELKYTNDTRTGLHIHACWVYELVCEGDQQASVSCCVFARTGLEKKIK